MTNSKLIEIEKPFNGNEKHLVVIKSGIYIQFNFLDKFLNNQGCMNLTEEQAKLLLKELMNQIYGEI